MYRCVCFFACVFLFVGALIIADVHAIDNVHVHVFLHVFSFVGALITTDVHARDTVQVCLLYVYARVCVHFILKHQQALSSVSVDVTHTPSCSIANTLQLSR